MEILNQKISALLAQKPNAVIGIDGCCASGKTTLAARLAEQYGAQVIHMDDFFLPPEMRTQERLLEAGGNVHYERFNSEVVTGLKNGGDFEYGVFNCKTSCITDKKTVNTKKPVIIEGAYALHPKISIEYDLRIFVTVSLKTQLERITARNGSGELAAFTSKWIPLENKYFSEYHIAEKCNLIITNE